MMCVCVCVCVCVSVSIYPLFATDQQYLRLVLENVLKASFEIQSQKAMFPARDLIIAIDKTLIILIVVVVVFAKCDSNQTRLQWK